METIKPVAWAFKQDWARFQADNYECRLLPQFYWGFDLGNHDDYEPLYDKSAIDSMQARIDALSELIKNKGEPNEPASQE